MKIKRFILGELQTNCYVIECEKDFIVVDPGFEDQSLYDYLTGLDKVAKYLLLTHNHYDHVSGAYRVKELFPDINTVMHREDAENMNNSVLTGEVVFSRNIKKFNLDILAEHKQTIEFNEHKIILYHTPGHTAGSMSIQLENIIFTGDVLFRGSIGRCDLPTGDINKLCRSLEFYYSLGQNFDIYPGHGEYTTLNNEKSTRDYFCK